MFYIEAVFNWTLLYYKDWIKKNVQLSITELKLDLRMFCKGWSIYKMALTILKPKQGKVSDFERFKERRFTQIL